MKQFFLLAALLGASSVALADEAINAKKPDITKFCYYAGQPYSEGDDLPTDPVKVCRFVREDGRMEWINPSALVFK